jgi:co-chaperonin GroES (HSP10)
METGLRIGNETLACIPASANVRPLRDQIVIEPMDFEPSKIISTVYRGKPLRGRILAVGPGCYPKKYNGPKGKRTKSWDSKHFQPMELKVGDVVELGGLEIGGYLHPTFRWGDKECVMAREADVAMVCE